MYIYHALINALSAHMTHINLNMIFYTHVEHSPTKTIYIKYYKKQNKTKTRTHYKHTHARTHTHTHTHIHTHTHTDCSRNWVLRMEILWEEEGFQFGFKRWQGCVMGVVVLVVVVVSLPQVSVDQHWCERRPAACAFQYWDDTPAAGVGCSILMWHTCCRCQLFNTDVIHRCRCRLFNTDVTHLLHLLDCSILTWCNCCRCQLFNMDVIHLLKELVAQYWHDTPAAGVGCSILPWYTCCTSSTVQ